MTVQDCIDIWRNTAVSLKKEAERAPPDLGDFIASIRDKASIYEECAKKLEEEVGNTDTVGHSHAGGGD